MQSAHSQRHPGGTVSRISPAGIQPVPEPAAGVCVRIFRILCNYDCLAIFALLGWNLIGHHSVNYADSYLYVGFPAGVIVLLVALPVFGTLWIRAKLRK